MDDRDYGIIGAALSSIIGAVALIYGLPEVKAFGGVLVGAAVTYAVQTRLQSQAEKNKIRKQNIEETLIPVLLMLRDIKLNLETAGLFEAQDNWHLYKQDYRRFIFTEKFYNELDEFFKSYSDYYIKLSTIRHSFFSITNQLFEQLFFIKIEPQFTLLQNKDLPCFQLYWNDFFFDRIPFDEPLILGYDPFVVYNRKHNNFNIKNVELIVDVRTYAGNQSGKIEHRVQLRNHIDLFNEFIGFIKKEFDDKQDVIELRELNTQLINGVSKSISKLEKYVNEYYPVEPIK